MELAGQRRLPVDRATAWRALNDAQVLKASIPGCESIEKTGADEYAVTVATVLGPVRAKFRGKLRLEDIVAPERYTLRFEGEGGPAGFARGSAKVTLSESAGETILDYTTNAQVGGRIAQVGNRLVDSAARKLADDFFATFEKVVSGTTSGAAAKVVPDTGFLGQYTPFQAGLVAMILVAVVAAFAFILQ